MFSRTLKAFSLRNHKNPHECAGKQGCWDELLENSFNVSHDCSFLGGTSEGLEMITEQEQEHGREARPLKGMLVIEFTAHGFCR